MNKQLLKLIPVIAFSTVTFTDDASACTGIRISAKDGSVVYGRTLEFANPIPTELLFVPEGYPYIGTTTSQKQDGKKWDVKYAYTGIAPTTYNVVIDGINSKGLAAGIFLFPNYAGYQPMSENKRDQSIAPWEVVTYILSQYSTLDEVKRGIEQVNVVAVKNPIFNNEVPPVHYIVHDQRGNSLVIEYLNGQLTMHDAPLGVITNSPSYDWHMTNLGNYVNLSVNNYPQVDLKDKVKLTGLGQGTGLLGMPGDFTPPSRFVRAVVFSNSEVAAQTGDEGVFQVFHILNQFDIPKGSIRDKDGKQVQTDYTQWTSAYDLNAKKMYYRTYQNPQIRMLDLNKLDSKSTVIERFPMDNDKGTPLATEILPNI